MKITPTQYANARGITLSAVTKRIREEKPMQGVVKITKYGRFYVLKVKKDFQLVK